MGQQTCLQKEDDMKTFILNHYNPKCKLVGMEALTLDQLKKDVRLTWLVGQFELDVPDQCPIGASFKTSAGYATLVEQGDLSEFITEHEYGHILLNHQFDADNDDVNTKNDIEADTYASSKLGKEKVLDALLSVQRKFDIPYLDQRIDAIRAL